MTDFIFDNNSGKNVGVENSTQEEGKHHQVDFEMNFFDEISQVTNLMKKGFISQEQGCGIIANIAGQSEKKQVHNSNLIDANGDIPKETSNTSHNANISSNKNYEKFFGYLKDFNFSLTDDDYATVSAFLEDIEKNAIERYAQQLRHEKNLAIRNEIAKSRLTSAAQNSTFENNKSKTFTREEIGKMSRADFIKNEQAIMSQLREGLIK